MDFQWIFSPMSSTGSLLESDLLRRNDYRKQKPFQCTFGHLSIVLRLEKRNLSLSKRIPHNVRFCSGKSSQCYMDFSSSWNKFEASKQTNFQPLNLVDL